MLEICSATLGYVEKNNKKTVLENISFEINKGEVLCILGANGAGKTTLFRSILGFEQLLAGKMKIDGSDIHGMSRQELAKRIAYVPQQHIPPFPYSVYEVVLMGRCAHVQGFSVPSENDEKEAMKALEWLGLEEMKTEVYTRLSGGERQLVLIARALAQDADYILMDEPAANHDFGNQLKLLKTINALAEAGKGVCFTSHNPDHAFLIKTRVLALEGKNSWEIGQAEDVITPKLLSVMYGIKAGITTYTGEDEAVYKQVSPEI